jgi:hypothetical protein
LNARRFIGAALMIACVIGVAVLLLPGFATLVGRVIANLWVTVMAAVAGILGGFLGL